MKNRLYIIALLLILPTTLWAQYEEYDLSSYINPDYKRKSLDIGFNSSGVFYKNNTTNKNSLKGLADFSYNRTILSRKLQETLNVGIATNIDQIRFDSVELKKRRAIDVGVVFNQKAHYYIDTRRFIEISPRAEVGYNYIKQKSPATEYHNQKNNAFHSEVEVDIGFGKGRIEDVTDARQAIYILVDLNKKRVLKKQLSSDEINELAKQMAIVKNRRHFDARQKTIDELTFVNDYLVSKNYIDTVNTAEYFLSLNDYWKNGDLVRREAGRRLKFGIAPTYIFSQEITAFQAEYEPKSKFTDTKWGGTLYVDYTNEKPVNLKWQRSFNVGIRNGLYRWRSMGCNQFLSHAYAQFGMGYFLDTRTYFKWALNQDFYYNYRPHKGSLPKENTIQSYTTLTVSGYYYISSQVRLSGEYNLAYNFLRRTEARETIKDKYPRSIFEIGITFSIF